MNAFQMQKDVSKTACKQYATLMYSFTPGKPVIVHELSSYLEEIRGAFC